MSARNDNIALATKLQLRGVRATPDQAQILRRAEMTLHRWYELECGDGNDFASWSIERDETTGEPYKCVYPHKGEMRRYRIADREKGAVKRIQKLCEEIGAHFYLQTDPRGCGLYVATEPLTDSNYSSVGIDCCV